MRIYEDHNTKTTGDENTKIIADDLLKFYEFEKYFHEKSKLEDVNHPCSLRDEDDTNSQNINKCSSNGYCFEEGDEGGYLNSNCNARESCGKYVVEVLEENEEGRMMS